MDPRPPRTSGFEDTTLQLRSQLNELWLGANGHFGPDAQSFATCMLQSFSVMREYNGWGSGPAMSTPPACHWRTATDQESQPRDTFHGGNGSDSSSSDGMQDDAAHYSESWTVRALLGATIGGGASSSTAESSAPPEVRTEDATPTTGVPPAPGTSGNSLCVVPCADARVISQAARLFAGASAHSATESEAPTMRRGKTKKEEQVDRFNAQSSAPVVTYISEDEFRCEYCSALTRKPKILHFHPSGKGDPIAGHHTQHNNHRGKVDLIKAWCEACKQHRIRDKSGALKQGTLQGFLRPVAPTPQPHATKLSETFHGRCDRLAKNTRAATQANVAALSSAVCHGFEPSCIWLRHRTVSKIRVDIDELRGDDFRAGQPDGTADGFRVDVGYRWKRSDGSEVVGALRSTNCSKVFCQHCRHLDKNISFVRAVRAHLDANDSDRGLQRGERTSTLCLILARGAASGSGQASTTLF